MAVAVAAAAAVVMAATTRHLPTAAALPCLPAAATLPACRCQWRVAARRVPAPEGLHLTLHTTPPPLEGRRSGARAACARAAHACCRRCFCLSAAAAAILAVVAAAAGGGGCGGRAACRARACTPAFLGPGAALSRAFLVRACVRPLAAGLFFCYWVCCASSCLASGHCTHTLACEVPRGALRCHRATGSFVFLVSCVPAATPMARARRWAASSAQATVLPCVRACCGGARTCAPGDGATAARCSCCSSVLACVCAPSPVVRCACLPLAAPPTRFLFCPPPFIRRRGAHTTTPASSRTHSHTQPHATRGGVGGFPLLLLVTGGDCVVCCPWCSVCVCVCAPPRCCGDMTDPLRRPIARAHAHVFTGQLRLCPPPLRPGGRAATAAAAVCLCACARARACAAS